MRKITLTGFVAIGFTIIYAVLLSAAIDQGNMLGTVAALGMIAVNCVAFKLDGIRG